MLSLKAQFAARKPRVAGSSVLECSIRYERFLLELELMVSELIDDSGKID
jgi:hypothetical protein